MFGLLSSLFWHIDNENLLSRLKAAMVSLKTSETEDRQNFENEKSETTILLDFPLAFSWCTPFFLGMLFSWRNLQNKMLTFSLFRKNEKTLTLKVEFLHVKCVKKKILSDHLHRLSERIILHPRTFIRDSR